MPRSGWVQRASASTPTTRAGLELDDRLVVQAQVAARRRPARRSASACTRSSRSWCIADSNRTNSVRSEVFARYIARSALLQQLVGRLVAALVERDADRRAERHLTAVELEVVGEHAAHPVGHPHRARLGLLAGDEDAELVAAEARDEVAGTDAVLEPLADEREQPVADGVTLRVVDGLEAVEVEEEHGDAVDVGVGRAPRACARGTARGSRGR